MGLNCVYTPFCEDYGPSYQVMIEFGQDLLQKYFVRILAFSRKKHHFNDFLGFFSHFFRFLQREFHVVGGTLGHEFGGN